MNPGDAPPPPSPPTGSGRLWPLRLFQGLAALVLAGAAVLAVQWWTFRNPGDHVESEARLEDQWDDSISRLGSGIEPVYPPEEDIAVGDVFVTVTADAVGAPNGRDATRRAFLGKSVKIGHAPVAEALQQQYDELPQFSTLPPGVGATPPLGAPPPRLFADRTPRVDLPVAAFPGLTITTRSSAETGLAAARGWFDFGASRGQTRKLILGLIETYGLDPPAAERALTKFCGEKQGLCGESIARRYLRALFADRVDDTHLDPLTKKFAYDLEVHVIMVSRVYLTREILEQSSAAVNEGGGGGAGAMKVAPSFAAPSPSSDADPAAALRSRLTAVESRLGGADPGATLLFRSESGTEVLLDKKFPRPVAIGYRSVYLPIDGGSTP